MTREALDRYIGLVRRIALAKENRFDGADELLSAGLLGLAEAIKSYRHVEGATFEAYAQQRIIGAMRDYRRSRDLLSRNERDELKRLTRTKAQLTKELGREPEDLEVARSAGMGLSCYRQAIASLTRTAEQLDEIQDLSRSPEMVALVRRDHARLSGYIDELPERLRRILRCYYVHDRSFAWIATRLHLSEVRVCQLHGEAIRLLRRKCGPRKVLQTVRPR